MKKNIYFIFFLLIFSNTFFSCKELIDPDPIIYNFTVDQLNIMVGDTVWFRFEGDFYDNYVIRFGDGAEKYGTYEDEYHQEIPGSFRYYVRISHVYNKVGIYDEIYLTIGSYNEKEKDDILAVEKLDAPITVLENEPDTTSCNYGTVTDIDGNLYKTMVIAMLGGEYEWMAENLRTTRFNDGSEIPYGETLEEWAVNSPVYCWYKNDTIYKDRGAMYNFFTAKMDTLLCPEGWKVPGAIEWDLLLHTINPNNLKDNSSQTISHSSSLFNENSLFDCFHTAKNQGIYFRNYFQPDDDWDEYGFNISINNKHFWWSKNQRINDGQAFYALIIDGGDLYTEADHPFYGMSVRCIRVKE